MQAGAMDPEAAHRPSVLGLSCHRATPLHRGQGTPYGSLSKASRVFPAFPVRRGGGPPPPTLLLPPPRPELKGTNPASMEILPSTINPCPNTKMAIQPEGHKGRDDRTPVTQTPARYKAQRPEAQESRNPEAMEPRETRTPPCYIPTSNQTPHGHQDRESITTRD